MSRSNKRDEAKFRSAVVREGLPVILDRLNTNRSALARKLDITDSSMSAFSTGARNLPLEALMLLSGLLGYSDVDQMIDALRDGNGHASDQFSNRHPQGELVVSSRVQPTAREASSIPPAPQGIDVDLFRSIVHDKDRARRDGSLEFYSKYPDADADVIIRQYLGQAPRPGQTANLWFQRLESKYLAVKATRRLDKARKAKAVGA